MAATSPPPNAGRDVPPGPPDGHGRRNSAALILSIVAATLAVVALVLVLALDGGDGEDSAAENGAGVERPVDAAKSDDRPGSEPQESVEPGAAPQQAGALPGSLQAGGQPVLPDRPQALATAIGQPVEGARLLALRRVDGGFFIGTGPADQIFVAGDLPADYANGMRLSLEGTARQAPESAGEIGLDPEDLEVVKDRGAYVEATNVTAEG